MRSSLEPPLRPSRARRAPLRAAALSSILLGGAAALGAACSSSDESAPADEGASCSVGYDDFAGPFLLNWCVGCHSAHLPARSRQAAPVGVDFDTLDGVREHADRVRFRVVEDRGMPPVGGPTAEERALFGEWIDCGMPAQGGGFTPPPPVVDDGAPPPPEGACAEPRKPLPASLLPRCQAATRDCIVQCGVESAEQDIDACRSACIAADETEPGSLLGSPITCQSCTSLQLLACADQGGCHAGTAAFRCCIEECAGDEDCIAARCSGEEQALGVCVYYTAAQCLDYLDGPMAECFADTAQ